MNKEKKILFVRSGGGMPGLDIHAGINLALYKNGIRATHNVGCSAGAIVAALDSNGFSPLAIEMLIRSLTDYDVRKERFAWKARALWVDYFLEHEPIVALLKKLLPAEFGDLVKPLQVAATRCRDAGKVLFPGTYFISPREAVLASMSIHGVFPTVSIDDELYCDGGVRNNLPLPRDWENYDEVWLIIATPPTSYRQRSGILARLMLNIAWLMRDQIEDVIEQTSGNPKVKVIWPNVGKFSAMLRFDHDLINLAKMEADKQIKAQLTTEVEPCTV